MSYRAAVLILQDDKIALIERHRAGLHYFTFPGGHVDEGETPEQAAVRETLEELGLDVSLERLVAKMGWQGKWQYYYLAEVTGGMFGTGAGEEMHRPRPEKGTYHPIWMPLAELLLLPVKPPQMAELVVRFAKEGWPEEPVIIPE
jgi:8-oxo-dGTP pyrophosphatase MutT (NUDIX family)